MGNSKVAARYASSLFKIAKEANVMGEVKQDMDAFSQACIENVDLVKALKSPIIPASQKFSMLSKIFANCQKETKSFFELMTNKNRAEELLGASQTYKQLYNEHNGIVYVNISSAQALKKEEQVELENFLKKQTGAKQIEIKEDINPDLIGGMVIKYGDRLLDNSVLSQINKLKKELDIA